MNVEKCFCRMKNAVSVLKIAVILLFFYDRLEVFAFIASKKMKLVASLMCILTPLCALLCTGKFDTVAKLFVVIYNGQYVCAWNK